MNSDPAGLLHRIPELENLCQDGRVRAAVASGDPFRVYRALMWARLRGRLSQHREVIDRLLRNRRLFAKPGGKPLLGTWNTIGVGFADEREPDPKDGTVVSTHALVILLSLPILPLGAYVVRKEATTGVSSRWSVFAKAPLSPTAWLHARVVGVAALLLVLGGVAMAVKAARYNDVWVVNGFDQPLDVTIGGRSATVPARAYLKVRYVPQGKQLARAASAAGVEVDALSFNVPRHADVVAWNVAGAGVLFRSVVTYTETYPPRPAGAVPAPSPPMIYCGQREVVLDAIDHVFEPPPEEIEDTRGGTVRRFRVDMARAVEDQPAWCYRYLGSKNRLTDALPAVIARAALAGGSAEATRLAAQVQSRIDPAKAVAMLRSARDAHPDDLTRHLDYQDFTTRLLPTADLEADYAARAAAAPDSPDAQYLHVRLLRGAPGEAAAKELARRFPDHPQVLRHVAMNRYIRGDWQGAHDAWERLRAVAPELAIDAAQVEVTALTGLGQLAPAMARARELFGAAAPPRRPELAELYARVAKLAGDPAPDALIAELEEGVREEEPTFRLWSLRARCGLDTGGADAGEHVVLFSRDVAVAPKKALATAARMTEQDVLDVDLASWALGYAEAVVAADEAAQRSLSRRMQLGPQALDEVRQFLRGERSGLSDSELLPPIRSAFYAVRARLEASAPAKRKALLDQALNADPLPTSVDDAVARWQL